MDTNRRFADLFADIWRDARVTPDSVSAFTQPTEPPNDEAATTAQSEFVSRFGDYVDYRHIADYDRADSTDRTGYRFVSRPSGRWETMRENNTEDVYRRYRDVFFNAFCDASATATVRVSVEESVEDVDPDELEKLLNKEFVYE